MAITNWNNFIAAGTQKPWYADALSDILTGYKMQREPAKMREEQAQREALTKLKNLEVEHKPKEYELSDQGKRLANALHAKALEQADEKFQWARDLNKAKIDKLNRPGGGSSLKPNAAVANAEYLWNLEHPEGDSTPELKQQHVDALRKAFQTAQEHVQTLTNRSADITSGAPFDKLPMDEKKRAVALASGMGYDPVEATKMLRAGATLDGLAAAKGQDISDVNPVYPLGTENVKQLQRRKGYINELKNLESKTAEPLSRYPSRIKGYSLEQIADSLDTKDPNEMGKVLAARALSPEIAALRLKVAGGNIGIEAIRELQHKSMTNLQTVEALVDTPTYLAMQKYMTEWLEEAAESFNTTMEDYSKLQKPHAKHGKTYDLATRTWK